MAPPNGRRGFTLAIIWAALASCAGGLASAQILTISAGSSGDRYFSGGTACLAGQPCMGSPGLTVYPSLRYGASFSYSIPVLPGMYLVSLRWAEPNKTAAGQRVFTVTANGQQSQKIDVYASAGADNVPYGLDIPVLATFGQISLAFVASAGNAIISQIAIAPYPQIPGPPGPAGPPGPSSINPGLRWISETTAANGTRYKPAHAPAGTVALWYYFQQSADTLAWISATANPDATGYITLPPMPANPWPGSSIVVLQYWTADAP